METDKQPIAAEPAAYVEMSDGRIRWLKALPLPLTTAPVITLPQENLTFRYPIVIEDDSKLATVTLPGALHLVDTAVNYGQHTRITLDLSLIHI